MTQKLKDMSRKTTSTKPKRRYNCMIPDSLKRQIVNLYITKQRTERSLAAEFNVSCPTIQFWTHKFAASNPEILRSRPDATRPDATAAEAAVAKPTLSTIPPAAMEQYKPLENLPDDPEELKKIIEELHYKVHSRDVMIDIAEEMFGIQIKKKLGPKR